MPVKHFPLEDALWVHTALPAPETPRLEGEARADVVVIGGGYTGLSTALHLAGSGVEVVVLEAAEIGYGGSGRNAGHCNPTFIMHLPDRVVEILGPEHGPRMVRLQTEAARLVFDLIREHGIDCEAEQNGIVMAAHAPSALAKCEARCEQYAPLIDGCRMLDKDEVEALTGSDKYFGGWIVPEGGHLNPLGYARGLASAALKEGARVFTQSPVESVTPKGGGWCAKTPQGEVTADNVVIGTNAYTGDFWDKLDTTFYRIIAYNVASQPLGENARGTILPGGHNVIDTRGHTHYYKLDKDGRLVTGSIASVRRGWERELTAGVFTRRMQHVFPQIGALEWPWLWYGYLAMNRETLPKLYEPAPGVVAALGYSGRGVPTATTMGRELARMLTGTPREELALPITRPKPLRGRGLLSKAVPLILGPYHRWQDARGMRRDGLKPPRM